MLESKFQAKLITKLRTIFPGCVILKNDSAYLQGIPDLIILWNDRWACLEVKANAESPFRPNQKYYLDLLNEMSFAACVHPSNEQEVLRALQHAFGLSGNTRVSRRE